MCEFYSGKNCKWGQLDLTPGNICTASSVKYVYKAWYALAYCAYNFIRGLSHKKETVRVNGSNKLTIIVVVVALIFGSVGIIFGVSQRNVSKNTPVLKADEALTTITLEEILKPASELVSMKYSYTDADIYEQSKSAFGVKVPFTTDKVVFTYSEVISAGIDISEVKYDIDDASKRITITLPEPQILSHQMDEKSFKFFDVQNSIFTETSLENYSELMSELKATKENQLLEDATFFDSVTENTQNVLKDFLTVSDKTKDYTVIFK